MAEAGARGAGLGAIIRIELVPPREAAEAAARVLAGAWKPPCLRYTPEYMAWQLGFPGEVGPLAAIAWSGAEPVGCAASTPRRVRLGSEDREVHLVSFVAVSPGFRGQGIAPKLYAALLGRLRQRGRAVVTFAQAGSEGQRVLEAAYARAGFALKPLAPHHVFGYRDRKEPVEPLPAAEHEPAALDTMMEGCRGGSILWAVPSPSERDQLLRGPHPCVFLVARGPRRGIQGGALATRVETLTPRGPLPVATIDTFFLPEAQPETVRRYLAAAARLFPESGPIATTASLPAFVDPASLPRAQVRRMPSTFNAWVAASRADDTLLQATATTLAVV